MIATESPSRRGLSRDNVKIDTSNREARPAQSMDPGEIGRAVRIPWRLC